MDEETEVLKQYIESLGLHEKETISVEDKKELEMSLRDADENGLADFVKRTPANELQDYVRDTLYG